MQRDAKEERKGNQYAFLTVNNSRKQRENLPHKSSEEQTKTKHPKKYSKKI